MNNLQVASVHEYGQGEQDRFNDDNSQSNHNSKRWTRRRVLLVSGLGVIVLISIVLGVVLPKKNNNSTSSSENLQTSGPLMPEAQVDQATIEANQNSFIGSTLMSEYVKLSIPNWSTTVADTNSPQGKALYWITSRANFPQLSAATNLQRYALAVFYYSTFKQDHDFMDTEPADWTSSDDWISDKNECQWEGVICNGSSEVTGILLNSYELTGTLPREVAMLSSISELDLTSNYIYMEGTALDVFKSMKTLTKLRMEDNFIVCVTGLPSQFSSLISLEVLQLSYNLLQGEISGSILTPLVNLEHLEMESNYLSGSLPSEISVMPNLIYLYARRNVFEFNFAEFLNTRPSASFNTSFPNLFSLWLDNNYITGSIPTTIGLISGLASISITNTSLTGSIPTQFGSLTDLKRVWLYDNELSGTLPTQLDNLKALEVFEIHDNYINGTMLADICSYISQSDYEYRTLTADCDRISCDCCTVCYNENQ
jgi:hypothetical protein